MATGPMQGRSPAITAVSEVFRTAQVRVPAIQVLLAPELPPTLGYGEVVAATVISENPRKAQVVAPATTLLLTGVPGIKGTARAPAIQYMFPTPYNARTSNVYLEVVGGAPYEVTSFGTHLEIVGRAPVIVNNTRVKMEVVGSAPLNIRSTSAAVEVVAESTIVVPKPKQYVTWFTS